MIVNKTKKRTQENFGSSLKEMKPTDYGPATGYATYARARTHTNTHTHTHTLTMILILTLTTKMKMSVLQL